MDAGSPAATAVLPQGSSSAPARQPAPAAASALTRTRVRAAWLFLLPMLLVMALTAVWPLGKTVWLGFTDSLLNPYTDSFIADGSSRAFPLRYGDDSGAALRVELSDTTLPADAWAVQDGGKTLVLDNAPAEGARVTATYLPRFVGLENYIYLAQDPVWWRAIGNTVKFTLISVLLETVLGLAIALAMNESFRGKGGLRAAALVPWAIPTIVSAQMWSWMFHDLYGVINTMLMEIGIISQPIAWTANPDTALWAIVFVDVWKTTPFMALLILAALQLLPKEIYEAARVDGIPAWKRLTHITLPLIKPALLVAVIFRTLDALRVFDLIYVLSSNSRDTMSMSVYVRQQLIDFGEVGYGSAAATFLFLIIAGLTALYLVVGKVKLDEAK
jgi:trehalose/maltose transport system permease protein